MFLIPLTMNPREFLDFTYSSFRKLRYGTNKAKDNLILQEAHKRLKEFYNAYLSEFSSQLSDQQKAILQELIVFCEKCSKLAEKEGCIKVRDLIAEFENLGVVYLIRHPEPVVQSYQLDKEASKTLTVSGKIQVWKFNKYIQRALEAYPTVTVELYYSSKYRTQIFAKLTHHYLKRNAPCILKETMLLDDLYVKTCVPEMKELYPELKELLEKEKRVTKRYLTTLRQYFQKWTIESPTAKQIATSVNVLVQNIKPGKILLYYTHENVIGPYLHFYQGYDIQSAYIKPGRFVRAVVGRTFVQKG